jgi:thiol-disulfide isomerase/thioredoxin
MKRAAAVFIFLFSIPFLFGQGEMLGTITREEILENFPEWGELAAAYNPHPVSIEKLKFVDRLIQVEIFLGTWCPDSKVHVSAYFKILDMTANPNIRSAYIGIPRDRASRKEYIPEDKNVIRLPTFIIYEDGREIGRIIETPQKSVEEDLLDIIFK